MNITININAPELVEAIQALASALSTGRSIIPETGAVTAMNIESAVARETETFEAPQVEEPKEELKEEPKQKPQSSPSQVSLEQVRAVMTSLTQSGKQAEAKELIRSLGYKKLTDVPADRYAELLAAAEEIQ
ncbi:MAG TPA: hypothetical protein VK253_02920 [Candidatus Binatia bacterium]|nr:hypothetical protein [Candidatus Binatia bacterium]